MYAQTFSFSVRRPSEAGGIRGAAVGTNDNFGQTWDDARKSALVAQIVSGKLSVKAACERHELSPETIQDWVRVFRRTTLQALDEHLRQTFLIQGADAASLGSAEYTGTLADIPLSDLIQTFQMGAKDGVISVTSDGRRSRIWCRAGEIVDAESGRLRGELAAYRILALERGQVFADFRAEPRERSIEVPANLLLLEAARRKDESARLLDQLDGLKSIYRAVAPAAAETASAVEREVLLLCDGQADLSAVLERSELGDLELLAAVVALRARGAIVRERTPLAPAAIVVSKETPNAIVSADILGSVVSLSPLAASHRPPPARTRRTAPLAVLAAALVLGGGIWALARPRFTAQPSLRTASREPPGAPLTAAPEPASYEVDTVVEPAHAELWLDGLKVGVGRLRRELPHDGQAHSLRVVAEGHAPTTVLFRDAPPPNHVRLEPLSAAPSSAAPPSAAPPSAAPSSAPAPRDASPPEAPRAVLPASRPRRSSAVPPHATERTTERPRPAERGASPPGEAPAAPRVQIIEPTTPVVRIIE